MSMTVNEMMQAMAVAFFLLGMLTFVLGLFVLVVRSFGKNVSQITDQTHLMVQKGMAEDVSGLVGNATALLEAMQGMVQSARSIGMFLTLLGCSMMIGSGWLLISNFAV